MTNVNSVKSSDDYDDFLSFVGSRGAPLSPPPRNEASPAAPPTVRAAAAVDNDIPKKKNARKKTCTFSVVDIREHERIAGDNPCVSKGVPISIGWGYIQHPSISLDEYETYKGGQSRTKNEMLIPPEIRIRLLKDEFGISVQTINTAMKDALKVKKQREYTVNTDKTNNVSLTNAFRKLSRKMS